jgi:hypothetical protein
MQGMFWRSLYPIRLIVNVGFPVLFNERIKTDFLKVGELEKND